MAMDSVRSTELKQHAGDEALDGGGSSTQLQPPATPKVQTTSLSMVTPSMMDIHASIISETGAAEDRSRALAEKRKELSRRTEGALKRQQRAIEAKMKLEEKAKYAGYEFELQMHEKTRILDDGQSTARSNGGGSLSSRLNSAQHSARSVLSWASSSGWSGSSRDPAEEAAAKKIVSDAYQKIKDADANLSLEHRRLLEADAAAKEKEYNEDRGTFITRTPHRRSKHVRAHGRL